MKHMILKDLNFNDPSMVELFYLNSTLNFGIPTVLVFQLEVYYKVDRLLTGLTAQPKGTTAQWYSNKTSLFTISIILPDKNHWICHSYLFNISYEIILNVIKLLYFEVPTPRILFIKYSSIYGKPDNNRKH